MRFYLLAAILLLLPNIPQAFGRAEVFPGDTTQATIYCQNTGSVTLATVARLINSGGLEVSPELNDLGQIPPGRERLATFSIYVPTNTRPGPYSIAFQCDSVEMIERGGRVQSKFSVDVEVLSGGRPFLPGQCIIATATYGSPLAPEVQFLREFRDGYVLNSFSGRTFMNGFNLFYYSFSPQVAAFVGSNMLAKQLMQITLSPLLAILGLAHYVYLQVYQLDVEAAIMLSGLIASSLIGLAYVSPFPALLAWRSRTYRGTFFSAGMMRLRILFLFSSVGFVILASVIKVAALSSFATFATSAVIMLYAAVLPIWLFVKIKYR